MNTLEAQLREELAACHGRIRELQSQLTNTDLSDLAGRDRILSAVANAAQRFMLGGDLATEIDDLLRVLGQVTDVSRVYVFQHHMGQSGSPAISQRYEWTHDGVPAEIQNESLQELPCDDPSFARIYARLKSGDVVEGDLDAFEPAERAVLEPQGILSLLLVPILIQSEWWGFIGLDACRVRRRWASSEVDALRIAAGLVGASLCRQQAEEQVRQSEERLRILLDSTPGVAVEGYRPDGTIHYWNKASEDMFGYTASEAIGQNLVELIIPPDLRPFVRDAIRTGAETGNMPEPAEYAMMHRDGSLIPVHSSHAVITLPGRTPELFCTDIDLTTLKEVENELRQREREFMTMAENLPDIIMRFDRQCRHLYVNPAVSDVTGRRPEEFIGRTHAEIGFPEKLCAYWEKHITAAFAGGQSFQDSFDFETPEGSLVMEWQLTPELDEHGTVSTVLAISRDVTEVKRAQATLRDRQKETQELAQELALSREQLRRLRTHAEHVRENEQRLIAGRIHDGFGQRLTTLTMDLTWLRDSLCTPDTEAYRRFSSDLALIENLLAMARDVSMELRPSVLDHFGLPAALEWAAEKFEESASMPVDLDIDEEVRLARDAESGLYRIAQELLTNVTRHARAHSIGLSLRRLNQAAQMQIADDGIGMPPEALTGTSMGLLAARETALSLRGTMDIQSEPGHGTTVTVTLPFGDTP